MNMEIWSKKVKVEYYLEVVRGILKRYQWWR